MGKISDLASILAGKHGVEQKETEKFISQMFELLSEELNEEKLVKVKGLGTFKVTTVKDRASVDVNTGERIIIEGRDKISFTPDASMKNLVNKPFAQFVTVVLKDGVDFGEIDKKYNMEEETDEEIEENVEKPTIMSLVSESVEESLEEKKETEEILDEKEVEKPQEEKIIQEEIKDEEIVVENKSEDNIPQVAPILSTPTHTENESEIEEDEEEMKRSEELAQKLKHTNNIVKVLCAAIAILLLFGIYGLYSMNNKLNERDQQIQQFMEEKQKEEEQAKAEQLKLTKELEAYNNYDERVINGDYKIVGIEKEVTAVQGQTLKSISRMELGPGMDCYVQAVNPDIKMVLIGQQVKIPKLEHK
jgi:nucleoid DNA-binding protein